MVWSLGILWDVVWQAREGLYGRGNFQLCIDLLLASHDDGPFYMVVADSRCLS